MKRLRYLGFGHFRLTESPEKDTMTQQDYASKMDAMFKWPIGAKLTHISERLQPQAPPYPRNGTREERSEWRYAFSGRRGEAIYFVCERHAHQCPGGVQLFYLCRVMHSDGSIATGYIQFLEQELRELTPAEEVEQEAPKAPGAATLEASSP